MIILFTKKFKFVTGLRKRELFLDSKSECHNGLLMLTCLQRNHLLSAFSDLSSDLVEPKSVISVETDVELNIDHTFKKGSISMYQESRYILDSIKTK